MRNNILNLLLSSVVMSAFNVSTAAAQTNMTQTIIGASSVSGNTYISGVYNCNNFATDFACNAAAAGYGGMVWQVNIWPFPAEDSLSPATITAIEDDPNCIGHTLNIVMDSMTVRPGGIPSGTISTGIVTTQYCLVEPQDDTQVACWPQESEDGGSPPFLPPDAISQVIAGFPKMLTCMKTHGFASGSYSVIGL